MLIDALHLYVTVEYRDVLSASSAARNLNNGDFRGRALRVDYSDPNHRGKSARAAEGLPPAPRIPGPPPMMGGGLGPVPVHHGGGGGGFAPSGPPPNAPFHDPQELRKVFAAPPAAAAAASAGMGMQDTYMSDVRGGGGAAAAAAPSIPITIGSQAPTVQPGAQPYGTDTIAKLVTSLTKPQLLEILSEMKKFSAANPEGAKQLLFDSPQVAQTLLHILIMFGLVRPNDVANIQTQQRPVAGSMPMMALPGFVPPPAQPSYAAAPAYAPAPMLAALPPMPMQAPVAPRAAFTEEDAFMLQEIQKLTSDQIQNLPQDVQEKIRLLQQQLEAQQR